MHSPDVRLKAILPKPLLALTGLLLFGCVEGQTTRPQFAQKECLDCHKKFSLTLTVSDHDKTKVKCPKCGSRKTEQQYAAFFAVTSKKS